MAKLGAFFGGVFFGGLAGLALGLLSAPKAGKQLRKDIVDVSDNIYRKAAYELEEIAERVDEFRVKIDEQTELTGIVHDFTPRVHKAVQKAQSAVEDARETQAQSKQVLDRTQQS